MCARRRSPFFCWGLDAPTPARTVGLPPRWGQYFLSKRKKVPKKARGTALREKGFYCPFCRRGSQRRAQFSWIANTNVRARSCAHLFPPSKWAGLFPFAAYRRSAPPQLALGRLKWRCLGCFDVAWIFLQCKRPAGFHIHAGFFMRAGGPVARRRSFLFNWQVTAPNRRATRPVAERR